MHVAYVSAIKIDLVLCQRHKGRTKRRLERLPGGGDLELSDNRRDKPRWLITSTACAKV